MSDATPSKLAFWTTYGPVRGGCGHRHVTRVAAEWCAAADQRAVSRGPHLKSYSDRRTVAVGDDGYLYYDDKLTNWVPGGGGRSSGAARFADL